MSGEFLIDVSRSDGLSPGPKLDAAVQNRALLLLKYLSMAIFAILGERLISRNLLRKPLPMPIFTYGEIRLIANKPLMIENARPSRGLWTCGQADSDCPWGSL